MFWHSGSDHWFCVPAVAGSRSGAPEKALPHGRNVAVCRAVKPRADCNQEESNHQHCACRMPHHASGLTGGHWAYRHHAHNQPRNLYTQRFPRRSINSYSIRRTLVARPLVVLNIYPPKVVRSMRIVVPVSNRPRPALTSVQLWPLASSKTYSPRGRCRTPKREDSMICRLSGEEEYESGSVSLPKASSGLWLPLGAAASTGARESGLVCENLVSGSRDPVALCLASPSKHSSRVFASSILAHRSNSTVHSIPNTGWLSTARIKLEATYTNPGQ